MQCITAVGENWELGKNGELVFTSKADLEHFKQYTLGKAVIVGPKTYLSMPPLVGRKVICVAQDFGDRKRIVPKQKSDVFISKRVHLFRFMDEIVKSAEGKQLVLVGGEYTYYMFSHLVDELVVTSFDKRDEDADAYFPYYNYVDIIKGRKSYKVLDDGLLVTTYRKL